ncbi:MAG: hydrogenase maturation nickel metallochaperone HypA [Euryarchaeota archaeon]|nr:hydrogenase maturation nickel metallochaperone HypA [Euryarchaeota archaeon]
MHELSMADAIVKTILDIAEKNDAEEIIEVTIELGKLTLLNPEQLKFMLEVISEDTLLDGAEFKMEIIPVEIECGSCNYTGSIDSDELDHFTPILSCPQCGERDLKVISGRECNIKQIKIEKRE